MRNNKGLSLVEIIISLGLLTGLTASTTTFFSFQQKEAQSIEETYDMNSQNMMVQNILLKKTNCEKNFADLDLSLNTEVELTKIVNFADIKILDVGSGKKPNLVALKLVYIKDIDGSGLKEYKLRSTYMVGKRERIRNIPIYLRQGTPNECTYAELDNVNLSRKMNCEDLQGTWTELPPKCNLNGIQVGETTLCNEPIKGTIRFNSIGKVLELCDGINWIPVGLKTPAPVDNGLISTECLKASGMVLADTSSAYGGGVPDDGNMGGTGNTFCRFNAPTCPAGWKQYSGYMATSAVTLPCETKSFERSCECNGKVWSTKLIDQSFPVDIAVKPFSNRVPRLYSYSYYTMDEAALLTLKGSVSGKCQYGDKDNPCDNKYTHYRDTGLDYMAIVKLCDNQVVFTRSMRLKVSGDRQYCKTADGTPGSCPTVNYQPWMFQFPDHIGFTKKTGKMPVTAVGCTLQ